ncbi:MAG: hypothetical protein AB8F65_14965 [Woeseiaceae bacterium]
MNKKVMVILVAAILIAIGVFFLAADERAREPSSDNQSRGEVIVATENEPAPSLATLEVPDTASMQTVAELEHAIDDLKLASAAARNMRELAEVELEKTEASLAELEQYVADIEARGEDPADFAEEGLERFQPAFYAYEERMAVLEQAEQMEAAVSDELRDAERRLAMLKSTNN